MARGNAAAVPFNARECFKREQAVAAAVAGDVVCVCGVEELAVGGEDEGRGGGEGRGELDDVLGGGGAGDELGVLAVGAGAAVGDLEDEGWCGAAGGYWCG